MSASSSGYEGNCTAFFDFQLETDQSEEEGEAAVSGTTLDEAGSAACTARTLKEVLRDLALSEEGKAGAGTRRKGRGAKNSDLLEEVQGSCRVGVDELAMAMVRRNRGGAGEEQGEGGRS